MFYFLWSKMLFKYMKNLIMNYFLLSEHSTEWALNNNSSLFLLSGAPRLGEVRISQILKSKRENSTSWEVFA